MSVSTTCSNRCLKGMGEERGSGQRQMRCSIVRDGCLLVVVLTVGVRDGCLPVMLTVGVRDGCLLV